MATSSFGPIRICTRSAVIRDRFIDSWVLILNDRCETSKNGHSAISLKSIASYLAGNRSAILAFAQNPRTVWLGLILVFSAGFAREYDHEDLLRQPWHLLVPLMASLLTSFLLFCLIHVLAIHRGAETAGFRKGYRTFLGLYWMSAPLAWVYAIPVERFLPPEGAVFANMVLLAFVSFWRVVLIVRVIVVVYLAKTLTVLPVVLLFADSVMLFLFATLPHPVISIMGGTRRGYESVIAMVTAEAGIAGTLSLPFWLLGSLKVYGSTEPEWAYAVTATKTSAEIRRSVWVFVWASILGPILLLAVNDVFQPTIKAVPQN